MHKTESAINFAGLFVSFLEKSGTVNVVLFKLKKE